MSSQPDFTPEQILFIKNAVFDTLREHFNYDLSDKKRKAAMAKAFGATNFDALLQRCKRQADTATVSFSDSDASPMLRNSDLVICLDHLKKADHLMLSNFTYAQYKHALKDFVSHCDPSLIIFPATVLPQMIAILEQDEFAQHSALLAACHTASNEDASRLVICRESGFENDMVVDYSREFKSDNCLNGICCPECGNESSFVIDTEGTNPEAQDNPELENDIIVYPAHWTDDGSADTYGDTDFPADGECKCTECGHTAQTQAFMF